MKKLLKWIVIIIAVLFVIGLFVGGNESPSQTASPAEANTETTTPAEPPVDVTPNELLKAYKDNEIAANQKFKDKNIRITGTIEAIEEDFSDKPYLILKAGDNFEFNKPQAHLAESELSKAAQFKKGQKITLLCVGNSEVAGTPMLGNCVSQ